MNDAVFVIYNEDFSAVKVDALLKRKGWRVIVCDNSDDPSVKKRNRDAFRAFGGERFTYVDMNGNKGLSVAYNAAIEVAAPDDWLIWFDQDTVVPNIYFENFDKTTTGGAGIIIPKAASDADGFLLSPCVLKGHRVKALRDSTLFCELFDKFNRRGMITGINSGMAVKRVVYDKVGFYDERFFLDYIDHNFMRKCNAANVAVALNDCVLKQRFFAASKHSVNTALKRFLNFKYDFKIFCGDTVIGRLYYRFYTFCRSARYCVKYKSLKFFGRAKSLRARKSG